MGRSSYEWQGKAWIVNLRVLPTVPDGKSLSPLFSDVSKISCGVLDVCKRMKIKREDFYYRQAGSVNNQRIGGDGNTLFGPANLHRNINHGSYTDLNGQKPELRNKVVLQKMSRDIKGLTRTPTYIDKDTCFLQHNPLWFLDRFG